MAKTYSYKIDNEPVDKETFVAKVNDLKNTYEDADMDRIRDHPESEQFDQFHEFFTDLIIGFFDQLREKGHVVFEGVTFETNDKTEDLVDVFLELHEVIPTWCYDLSDEDDSDEEEEEEEEEVEEAVKPRTAVVKSFNKSIMISVLEALKNK
jgi:hypothetical protein